MYKCFSFNTKNGTALPPAPWKVSAVAQEKRRRSEEPEENHPPSKQQKVAAVKTINTDTVARLWEESDSDF